MEITDKKLQLLSSFMIMNSTKNNRNQKIQLLNSLSNTINSKDT